MKLIHHVKKHGKTITLHLKKHHKKYIFGILSATLLRKGVSLIAAYALVHNLSFSFADTVHQGESNNEGTVVEEIIINEQDIPTVPEEPVIVESNDSDIPTVSEEPVIVESNDSDIPTVSEEPVIVESDDSDIPTVPEEPVIVESNDSDIPTVPEEPVIIESDNGNGICDEGDIIITSPTEGDIVGKNFNITREYTNNDCTNNEYTIRLRDSNGTYLDIFTGDSNATGFKFDSTQLVSNYFQGHKIAIVSDDARVIYRKKDGGEFTIDNKAPEISNIEIELSTNNKKVNIGDTIRISFETDETLKAATTNILGQSAYLEENNGNTYTYSMDFTDKNTEGKIVYGIEYSDEIGNTGYYEGYENIELDYTKPEISNLEMSNDKENEINVRFNTNEGTNAHIVYVLSGLNKTESIDSTEKTGHEVILQNIRNKYIYNYSISIEDGAKNTINIGGNFQLSGNRVIFTNKEISSSDLLIEAGFKTGDENFLINKYNSFETCSQNITFKKLDLPIDGVTGKIAIPNFNDSNVNKLTNAFTIVLVEKLEGMALTQNAMDEIFEDLNNFLIIVKLVKDDKNECKQNMTHYYINRFKRTLTKYGIIK